MITWSPWNPVATKNTDPKTLSAIVNLVSAYSLSCKKVKYKPKIIVIISPIFLLNKSLLIILWWQKVTETPDARSTTVFSNGSWYGLSALIPTGGHAHPNSGVGESLLWKKAQKNETKNITSDTMNKIIPSRSPVVTAEVWKPRIVPSRATSRHHWNETKNKVIKAKSKRVKDL